MISPGMGSCEYTLNTLRYANRCFFFIFMYLNLLLLTEDLWWCDLVITVRFVCFWQGKGIEWHVQGSFSGKWYTPRDFWGGKLLRGGEWITPCILILSVRTFDSSTNHIEFDVFVLLISGWIELLFEWQATEFDHFEPVNCISASHNLIFLWFI